jgi:peptidoglycan/LPS O-acetylase OafA/YrhL
VNQAKPPPSKWKTVISRFSRVTSSGSYMPEIDGLRFVAIMAVLLYHAHILFFANAIPQGVNFPISWDWLNFAIGQGWFGVQIFFVISGFVLALPFAGQYLEGRKSVNLKTYYSRRMVRIGFPYLIALTLGLFFELSKGISFQECLPHYAAGMIYSHGLFYEGSLNPILFVSWTLEIEIQFYLLAPLLCKVFKLRSFALRAIILLTSIFLIQKLSGQLNHYFPSGIWPHSIVGQLQFFLAGLLLGDLYLTFWKNKPRSSSSAWAYDIVGVASWLFIPFALKINSSHSWLAYLLLIAFTCVLRGRLLKSLLSLPIVATLGGMCYSIYLFHGAILYFLHYSLIIPIFGIQKGNWPINLLPMALLILLTLLGCSVVYYFIERPSMRWGGKKKATSPNQS